MYKFTNVRNHFHFPEDKTFDQSSHLVNYIKTKGGNIFSNIQFIKTRVKFQMGHRVHRVKFNGGLNFILGYEDDNFVSDTKLNCTDISTNPKEYLANHTPQLHRGIMNMFIYANICKPIYVGHCLVPLLKNVFIDSSDDGKKTGHSRNYIVYNPMYIPLVTNAFSHIEINIRYDAGQIVSFPKGAITSLTLHFRKYKHN